MHARFAPIVVGAPGHAKLESLLEGGSARRVVAAERPAHHAAAPVIHIFARLQIVEGRARPALAFHHGMEPAEPQRCADSRLVDHEAGDAALGELVADRKINHLLDAIEPVAEHHARARAGTLASDKQRGKALAFVRYLDPFAIERTADDRALHDLQHGAISLPARCIVAALHALSRDVVGGGAGVFFRRAQKMPGRSGFVGKPDHAVGHVEIQDEKKASVSGVFALLGQVADAFVLLLSISPIAPPIPMQIFTDRRFHT